MAELDYAFLANYARVDPGGTLTAVGASFTHVQAGSVPTQHLLSVAGRIRSHIDAGPVPLRVTLTTPGDEIRLTFDAELQASEGARPYAGGRIGLLFAVTLAIPLPRVGLYEVTLRLDGAEEAARRLMFDVEIGPPPE